MALIIRELAAKLGLEVDWKQFAKGAAVVEVAKAGLGRLVSVATSTATHFMQMTKEAIAAGDAIKKGAQAAGVTRTTLQEMSYAAGLSGVRADEMRFGMARLSRAMLAAKSGAGEAGKTFSRLGVHVAGSDGALRDAGDIMEDLAERFRTMPDGAEKTALAMELFGRGGMRMIPMLNSGREGLAGLRREAHELGLVLSDEATEASEELNDNLERLHSVSQGLWRSAIGPLLPEINKLVVRFLAWRKANAEILRQRLQNVLGAVLSVLRFLGTAFAKVTVLIGLFTKQWKVLAAVAIPVVTAWAAANYRLIASFVATQAKAAWAARSMIWHWLKIAGPIALIAGAVLAVMAFFDDIATYRKAVAEGGTGINTLYGRFRAMLADWSKPHADDPWWLKAIKEFVQFTQLAIERWDEFNRRLNVASGKTAAGEETKASMFRRATYLTPPGLALETWRRWKSMREQGAAATPATAAGTAPAVVPVARGGGNSTSIQQTNHVQVTVHGAPGMSEERLGQIVVTHIEEHRRGELEAAAAALPATQ